MSQPLWLDDIQAVDEEAPADEAVRPFARVALALILTLLAMAAGWVAFLIFN